MLCTHQFALAKLHGKLEIVAGAVRERSRAEIEQINLELESRVIKRTLELANANEELRKEVAERKRAEAALRKRETQLMEAQALVNLGSWELDIDTEVVDWSEESYRIWGVDPLEFVPALDSIMALVHPDDRASVSALIARAREERGPITCEFRIVRRDGELRIVQSQSRSVVDSSGRIVKLYGTSLDITERRRAEDAIKKQSATLQEIFDHLPIMIRLSEADGRMSLVNRKWEQLLGWTMDELRQHGLELFSKIYPDVAQRERALKFIREANGDWQDFKSTRKDGRTIDTSWAVVSLSDGRSIGIGRDITERKRAEEALREAEQKYRELFENAKDATYVHDLDGCYTSVNRAAEALSG